MKILNKQNKYNQPFTDTIVIGNKIIEATITKVETTTDSRYSTFGVYDLYVAVYNGYGGKIEEEKVDGLYSTLPQAEILLNQMKETVIHRIELIG